MRGAVSEASRRPAGDGGSPSVGRRGVARRVRLRLPTQLAILGLATLLPGQGAAQEAACRLHGVGDYSRSVRVVGSDLYTHHGSGGVDYRCEDGLRIEADSAIVFEANNQVHLFGDVRFEDQGSQLSADSAFYFGADKQLRAWGNIRVRDHASDALITGQTLNYFRESAIREVDRLEVYDGNPHATVPPPPQPAAEPPAESDGPVAPYEIDAGHFILEGRRLFRARGDVIVVRDSLRTTGDTLVYDMERGLMTVTGNARVEQQDFVLTARSLTAEPDGRGDMVLARGDAQLAGENMLMVAPAIRVFLAGGAASRLIALRQVPPEEEAPDGLAGEVGLSPGDQARLRSLLQSEAAAALQGDEAPAQPSIATGAFNLWGDSVEVVAPGQVLDVVNAVGEARAETLANRAAADWEAPEIAAKDWIRGDTIVARFVPGEPETPSEPAETAEPATGPPPARLETLTASGTATSFYRLAPSDTLESADTTEAATQPALHYVAGDRITVFLEGGEVVQMDVEGQTVGYHLEPAPPSADSAAAGLDTAAVAPDTAALRRRGHPWT